MNLLKSSILGLLGAVIIVGGSAIGISSAAAASDTGCKLVVTAPISFVNNKNNTQTAWFVVTNPNDCASGTTIDVTLAVWKTCQYNGIPLSSQTLYSHTTAAVKVGVFDTVTAKLPTNSYYQTDLLLGSSATDNGTPNYTTVTRLGTDIGGVACSTPKPTPTPTPTPTPKPTPTPTPTPTSGSTATATATATSTPATPAATTTSQLVNTGPGDVVGIFAGVTTVGALLHRLVLRKLFI